MSTIKCKFTFPSGQSIIFSLDKNFQISKNFQLYEMANNLAKDDVKMIFNKEVLEFIEAYQKFRDAWGKPMTLNSQYRTKTYNASVKGASNSLHLYALAIDWGIGKYTKADAENILNMWKAITKSYGRIGGLNYYDTYIHLAFDEGKYFGAKEFVIRDYRTKK